MEQEQGRTCVISVFVNLRIHKRLVHHTQIILEDKIRTNFGILGGVLTEDVK